MHLPYRFLRSLPLFFVVLLCAHPAAAATLYYMEEASLPPVLLAPPPAEHSPAWKKEISEVRKAQHHLKKSEVAAMRNEQRVRVELMTGVIGPDFTAQNFPNTFLLLNHVLSDAEAVTAADKAYWNTRRPYIADPRVKLLVNGVDASPAYPSGHTTDSRVMAEVLGLLYPAKRAALRARAEEIAWRRVEAGVHYPVDLEGGRTLAMLIMGAFLQSDDFNDDLAAAQLEIEQKKQP